MAEDVKWIIGIGLTLAGLCFAYGRYVYSMITDGHKELHHRINTVRDEYVKRADLDAHLNRYDVRMRELRDEVRADVKDLKEEMKGTNQRLDVIMSKLTERR